MLRRIGVARVERARACLFQRSAAARPAADRAAHRFRRRQRRLWRGRAADRAQRRRLVAEALRSIGFEIVEGADLSQTDLVRTYRDFLAKVEASGPDTLAFVYFSGHALSFEGENFLLGVDARLARDSDIPIEGVRMSDLLRPFADSPARRQGHDDRRGAAAAVPAAGQGRWRAGSRQSTRRRAC